MAKLRKLRYYLRKTWTFAVSLLVVPLAVASFVLTLLGIIFRDLMRFAFNTLAPKPKEGENLGNPVYRWLVNINDILR